MADVQTTDINTKPTVTAIDSNDQIYISDGGTALKKISYTNLAKAIIEQYNASQLAGATKTIQSAFNELNSKSNTYIGTATGNDRQEFVQNLVTLINNKFPLANLANGTVLTGSATWSGQGYCGYVVTRNSGGANITVQIGGEIVSALIDTRNLAISAFTDLNSNLRNPQVITNPNDTFDSAPNRSYGRFVTQNYGDVTNVPDPTTSWTIDQYRDTLNYGYQVARRTNDNVAYYRNKFANAWNDWSKFPTRAEMDAMNLNYTSSADDIAGAVSGWINAAVAKGKTGFYSGNMTWSGHFSGLVVANVHVVSPARVTFLCIPQVGNYAGKHLTATLDGNNFQIYEFEGSRIL